VRKRRKRKRENEEISLRFDKQKVPARKFSLTVTFT
jgi:hypothetical protein